MTNTENTKPTTTTATGHVGIWLEVNFPEGDVYVDHTPDCDQGHREIECQGGCPIIKIED